MNAVKIVALIAFVIAVIVAALYAFHVASFEQAVVTLLAVLAGYLSGSALVA